MNRSFLRNTLVLAALVVAPAMVEAQVTDVASVTLNATRDETISVTAAAALNLGASIADNSTANNFPALTITTDYTINGGVNLIVLAYFGDPANALVSGTNAIPASRIEATADGVASYTAITGAVQDGFGVAGGTLQLESKAIPAGSAIGSETTTLNLRINTTGLQVPAGSYSGTLNLRAYVQ